METVLHVKHDELNNQFLKGLKALFKDAEELEIIISVVKKNKEIFPKESKKEYWKRIDKAIKDIKDGNGIRMTMKDLEKYARK